MKQTLFILAGLPYSGKTTLRRQMVEVCQASYISIDEIMDKNNVWKKGFTVQKDWNEAYSEGYQRLKSLLGEGRSVVFDNANLSFQERENVRQIAREKNVRFEFIYVDVPMEEILRRRTQNEKSRVRGHLSEAMFAAALRKIERPKPEEQAIYYRAGTEGRDWIESRILTLDRLNQKVDVAGST